MTGRHDTRSRALLLLGVIAGGTALGLIAASLIAGIRGGPLASQDRQVAAAPSASPASPGGRALLDPIQLPASPTAAGVVATHLDIPAIGVSTDLESLAVDQAGVLHPPTDFDRAGWYAGGVLPGRVGPAVIAGHLDSATRPAVFEHLPELQPGAKIIVGLSDGSSVSFDAQSSALVPKAAFPTASVYGNVPTPQLRLITCDGPFDRSTGHYTENLVVFAALSIPNP